MKRRRTISAKKYQEKMDEIIKMGLPIDETFIRMCEEACKYTIITQPALRKRDKVAKKVAKKCMNSKAKSMQRRKK